jgi:hypothetical protein
LPGTPSVIIPRLQLPAHLGSAGTQPVISPSTVISSISFTPQQDAQRAAS